MKNNELPCEQIELSVETLDALNTARLLHTWLEDLNYNDLIFTIVLEWMKRDGEESLNEMLHEFF
jgi:hypothetical protein